MIKNLAIALCRVSTPEQKLSNSLNRQEQSCLRKSGEIGVEIIKWISGDVSSKVGKNVKRPDLLEAHEICTKNRRVGYVIVDEVDRFMRSIGEMFYWIEMFKQLGVKVCFASNPELNDDNSRSRLLLSLDGFKAEGSNEERIRKSISGHEQAIKEGRYTFPPKPGYMKGTVAGVHILHPSEFAPFKDALDSIASRLYTPSEALKRLNESNFTLNRPPLKIDKFLKFIVDPYYAGILEVNKQVKARCEAGQHQKMISFEQHESIISVVSGRETRSFSKKQYNPEFPMNKLLMHDCQPDARFTGANQSNGHSAKKYPKYRCRGCGKQYPREVVNAALNNVFGQFDYTGSQRSEFIEALATIWQQKQRDDLQQQKTLQNRSERLQDTKSNLIREMADTDYSLRYDIQTEINKVKEEISEIESKISSFKNLQEDLVEFVKFALEYTNILKDDWWQLDPEERLQCQQLLFPNGIQFNSAQKVSTTQISTLYRLAANKKDLRFDRKSLLVELRGIAPRSAKLLTTRLQV